MQMAGKVKEALSKGLPYNVEYDRHFLSLEKFSRWHNPFPSGRNERTAQIENINVLKKENGKNQL